MVSKALTLQADNAGAINNLGVLYVQMDPPARAIATFEYGIRAAPQDELLYTNLGKTYVTPGNRAKVREVMLRLLEQKPASATAANALGELEIRELEIR